MFIRINSWLDQFRLFHRDEPLTSFWRVIFWWELRRLPFNLFVGCAGIVSCMVALLVGYVCEQRIGVPIGIPDPPIIAIFGVIAYGIGANVCYTGGWIMELGLRFILPEISGRIGRLAFIMGLSFSLLLSLLPGVLIFLLGLAALISPGKFANPDPGSG